jgi:lysophospholipase L1-like esterase
LDKFNFSEIVDWHYPTGSDLNKKYTIAGKFGIPETASAADTHFNMEGHNLIANEVIKHLEKEIKQGTLKL